MMAVTSGEAAADEAADGARDFLLLPADCLEGDLLGDLLLVSDAGLTSATQVTNSWYITENMGDD